MINSRYRAAWSLTLLAAAIGGSTVRAQEAKPAGEKGRFIDRGEYVEDKETGLMWQKDGAASGKRNFYEAADYAKGLKLGGITGWRVPTAKEFKTIFPANDAPFVNTGYTPDKCCGGGKEFRSYWTSELDKGEDYAFVFQWYANGGANNCYASKNYVFVRCVREAPKEVAKVEPLDEAASQKARALIAQLGDESFTTRESAFAALAALGPKVAAVLRTALKETGDPEIRFRLKALVELLDKP